MLLTLSTFGQKLFRNRNDRNWHEIYDLKWYLLLQSVKASLKSNQGIQCFLLSPFDTSLWLLWLFLLAAVPPEDWFDSQSTSWLLLLFLTWLEFLPRPLGLSDFNIFYLSAFVWALIFISCDLWLNYNFQGQGGTWLRSGCNHCVDMCECVRGVCGGGEQEKGRVSVWL